MNIKIHIFSTRYTFGHTLYFVYKTDKNDGYCCVSIEYSWLCKNQYIIHYYENKQSVNSEKNLTYFPWVKINNYIKYIVNKQSNLNVDNINYVGMKKIEYFLKKYPINM